MIFNKEIMKILIYDLDDTLYDTNLLKDKKKIVYDDELYRLLDNGHPSYIYTNAILEHAVDILERKDLLYLIRGRESGIYHRERENVRMKPYIMGYRYVEEDILHKQNISIFDSVEIYFFDDLPINLKTAKRMGWTTVLINPELYEEDYIDFKYSSIKEALGELKKKNII